MFGIEKMNWHLECNGKTFYNKLKAIEENLNNNSPIQFNVPQQYLDYDFSKKPEKSLYELCTQQAKQLRDRYETINLFYSGGCDSHYILKIFIDNNIKLDKIIMVKSGFKKADYEISDRALPFAKKLDIAFEVKQPSMEYYKKYYMSDSPGVRTQHEHWHHFRLNNHYENVKGTSSNTLNIFGKEKSKLCHIDDHWYTYFLDVEVTAQPGQFNFFIENPEIYSRQCHMLIEQIKLQKSPSEYNHITHYSNHQDFWNLSIGRYETSEEFPLKKIMYEGWYNNKDHEAIKSAEPRLVMAWKRRNDQLVKRYGDRWFNNGDPALGTIGVFSKFFCLTKKNVKTVDELYPDGFKI
jgi:hypothetical protein